MSDKLHHHHHHHVRSSSPLSHPINVNRDDEVNIVKDGNDDDDDRHSTSTPLRFDVQEFVGLSEDEVVDYDTAEEFLLHFSRIGQVHFVLKLLRMRDTKEISLNIDCKGESKANYGWTPLHLAAYFGHEDVIEVLLKHGANVDAQNEQGDTPLHKAAYTSRDQIVIRLISANANVFILNGDGLRPFELAKSEPIRQILAAAQKADIKKREEKFLSAARNGDLTTLKQLVEDATNPVNINCVDLSGNSALHCAAYRGQNQAVIYLLKNNIDTTIKNKRNQLAANVATTISLKQIIQEVHLSVMTPQTIASLKNRAVSRFEGLLLKKGRFFGWKLIWAVLERGVFSFFDNRANAAAGVRRKGYKYLEGAITESINSDESNQYVFQFLIIFGDRSRALFCLPKTQTELDLQKWLNAINDHIYFGTNFIKQGTRIDDSDDEDDVAKLLPLSSVQDIISTAAAHQKILEKQIRGLQQLFDEGAFLNINNNCNEAITDAISNRASSPGSDSVEGIHSLSIRPINFHLELILESSRNANTSLAQCLSVMSHQNEARQAVIRQEQDKVRVLEEALHSLAREHHDLERSISIQNCSSYNNNSSNNISVMDSIHHSSAGQMLSHHLLSKVRSITCLSQTTATDLDEYFDAFDDGDEMFDDNLSDRTITIPGELDDFKGGDQQSSNICGQLVQSGASNMIDGISFPKGAGLNSLTLFHTAQESTPQPKNANSAGVEAPDETTINDSISPLSPDDDDCEDLTLADEIDFCRYV